MFQNLSLKNKLMTGFSGPVITILALVSVMYLAAGYAEKASYRSKESFALAVTAKQMQQDIIQVQQWLTDISATRGLDGLADGFDEAEKSRQSFYVGVKEFREVYIRQKDQPRLQNLEKIVANFEKYYSVGKEMAKAYIAGGAESGNKTMGSFDTSASDLAEVFQPFVEENVSQGNSLVDSLVVFLHRMLTGALILGGLVILVTGVGATLFIRSITRPMQEISAGLRESANQVAIASGEVASASQMLAQGASEQASSLDETAATTEEITSMIKQDSENLHQADTLMQESRKVVSQADEVMIRLATSMAEISTASAETQKIVKTIDEIAFQTNLLALNAAVEAARAGEAGAGFAVVADEVRNLAMRAAEAAKNTSELISGTVSKVNAGSQLVREAEESFSQASQSTHRVGTLVADISKSSREQATAVAQLSKTISEVDVATQQAASAAEETASASEELSAHAEMMKGIALDLDRLIEGAGSGG